jgi:hypothetical protein
MSPRYIAEPSRYHLVGWLMDVLYAASHKSQGKLLGDDIDSCRKERKRESKDWLK